MGQPAGFYATQREAREAAAVATRPPLFDIFRRRQRRLERPSRPRFRALFSPPRHIVSKKAATADARPCARVAIFRRLLYYASGHEPAMLARECFVMMGTCPCACTTRACPSFDASRQEYLSRALRQRDAASHLRRLMAAGCSRNRLHCSAFARQRRFIFDAGSTPPSSTPEA